LREDLLAQLIRTLSTDKEQIDQTDDNTLIQKFVAPNETMQAVDTDPTTTKRTVSTFVWAGYVGATYYNANWVYNQGQYF
jgi:hypothetical protein